MIGFTTNVALIKKTSSSIIPKISSIRPQVTTSNHSLYQMTATSPSPIAASVGNGTKSIEFRKYHGIGNDFILIDNRISQTPILSPEESIKLCDRNFGIGADGIIFLLPSISADSDFQMRIYNSDGSEPEMCGNGIRCLAKFAYDLQIPTSSSNKYTIDTLAGLIIPEILEEENQQIRVDMGKPLYSPMESIPTTLKKQGDSLFINGKEWKMTCVSMGNPHAITFIKTEEEFTEINDNLDIIGRKFESHECFPQKTNTEFVYQVSENEFDMCVWERGAGRTKACGTGACAILVAAVLNNLTKKDNDVTIHLPGGDLIIRWISDTDHILMTGPAELVFNGKI